ncbi:hypothetical protein MUP77_23290 [Candidatus Bathyarchaeota archaeon]|jgi:hypothetical protein|nr:hypothetical protein [Candidatus Bathyarchaeota archaeon]
MEARIEKESFIVQEEELERCRMCGKMFKAYKVRTNRQESDSAICRECREKLA